MSTEPSPKNDDLGIVFNTTTKEHTPEEAARVVTPQKQTPATDAPTSHLGGQAIFDVGKAFSGDHVETGTIVSDRRHARPSLGESLAGAWSEWWDRTKAGVGKVIANVPQVTEEPVTIAPAETRTEVIAEAATHAAIAPKDDHHIVVEKLRTMGSDTERITGSPVTIAPPKPNSTKGEWAHFEDKTGEVSQKKAPATMPDLRRSAIAPDITKKITSPAVRNLMRERGEEKSTPSVQPAPVQKATVPPVPQKKHSSIVESAVHIAPRVQRDTNPTYSTPIPRPSQVKSGSIFGRETAPVAKAQPQKLAPRPPEPIPHTPRKQTPQAIPQPEPAPTRESDDESEVFHSNHSDWSLQELSPLQMHAHATPVPPEVRTTPPTPAPPPPSSTATLPLSHTPRYTVFTWMILGGIVLVGITLAVIASIYMNIFRGETLPEDTSIGSTTPTPLDEGAGEVVIFTDDTRASLETFATTVHRVKPTRTEIQIAITQGPVRERATAGMFLTNVGAGISLSTLRAFDDYFTAGSITVSETVPYFVFHTSRFDVLFAGLLAWEATIYTDLAPLFGSNPIANMTFTDTVVGGKPARVLVNDAGLDTIAYGFADHDTLIITKNREALEKLFLE